ncbi:hypothetical protein ACTA71_001559 [Dictyostelium dimigraforme]
MDGKSEYENICSSESPATTEVTTSKITTTGSITTTSSTIGQVTTTASTISTTASAIATKTSEITTGCGNEPDDDHGPKYPGCLDCKDLSREEMGKKCKYLKSEKKVCVDEHHKHHKSPKPICSLKCPPNHECKGNDNNQFQNDIQYYNNNGQDDYYVKNNFEDLRRFYHFQKQKVSTKIGSI